MTAGARWVARQCGEADRDDAGGAEPWRELPREMLDVFGAIVLGDDAPRKGCGKALKWLANNGFTREPKSAWNNRSGLPVLTEKGQRAAVGLGYGRVQQGLAEDGDGG